MIDPVKTAVEIDNERASDCACLKLIGMGYAWNGAEWVIPAPQQTWYRWRTAGSRSLAEDG